MFQCSSKQCPNKTIRQHHDAYASVRFGPTSALSKTIRQFPFDFPGDNKRSYFHRDCWNELCSVHANKRGAAARLIRKGQEIVELFDTVEEIQAAAHQVADWLRTSVRDEDDDDYEDAMDDSEDEGSEDDDDNAIRHVVIFTGAGISTAAGIGDFRGLFGLWTEQDMQKRASETIDRDPMEDELETANDEEVPYEDLRPTLAHEAIAWLMKDDQQKVHYVITQNCDGLHRLSGIPNELHSELHGCVFVEYCRACGKQFERNYDVGDDDASCYFEEMEEHGHSSLPKPRHAEQCPQCKLTHRTRRRCPQCRNKPLYDTVINFGDDLRRREILPARLHSEQADLMIVLGSSLTVSPANSLCAMAKRLVICNRQRTDFDNDATVRVFGDCDDFMGRILQELMEHRLAPSSEGVSDFQSWKEGRVQRLQDYDSIMKNNNTDS